MATNEIVFDPSEDLPEIDPADMTDEQRLSSIAQAHYNQVRGALSAMSDAVDISAHMASTAGLSDALINAIEDQAYSDHDEAAEAPDEPGDEPESEEASTVGQ